MMRIRSFVAPQQCDVDDDATIECLSDSSSDFSLNMRGEKRGLNRVIHSFNYALNASICSTSSSNSSRSTVTNLGGPLSMLRSLHDACRTGSFVIVEQLVKAKVCDVNATDCVMDHGVTPLDLALIHSDCDDTGKIVQFLLDHGAHVNHSANNGWTPLHIAASNGQIDTVQLLLDRNADTNAKENRGWTPLFVATFRGHFHVVQLLLQHAEQQLRQQNQPPCVGQIMVNSPDVHGQTLLMTACQRGHVDIVTLLLEHGANALLCDDEGMTAFKFSANSREITNLLLLHAPSSLSSTSTLKGFEEWSSSSSSTETPTSYTS